jgi:hypothetical protein
MISVRDALLPAIAAMFFLISGTTIAAAEVDRVEARFEIFGFAGLHVLTDRTTVEEAADRYAIATDLAIRVASPAYSSISEATPRFTDVSLKPSLTPLNTAPICAETASIVITASITAATEA